MSPTLDPSRTVSVYVFRRGAAGVEFLALLRSPDLPLGGSWQSVHGKIEPGETARAAALRELREETGLVPTRFYVANHVETFFDPAADCFLMVPVFAAEVEAASTVVVSREHVRAEWCSADEIADRFLWPTQQAAVASIVRDIVAPRQANPWLLLSDPEAPRA